MSEEAFDFLSSFISYHDLVILVQRDRKGSNLHNCPNPPWTQAQTTNCLPPWPRLGASVGQLGTKRTAIKILMKTPTDKIWINFNVCFSE